ncbi:carboxymethylenebutenolidase [Amorphus suaedae]
MPIRQEIIQLFDAFTHGGMSRRSFMTRLAGLAGGTAAAAALLPLLENNYAQAAIIAEDDGRIETERVSFDAGGTEVSAYLARPKGAEKRPAVIVIHENRGLNPHTEDVARRLAADGFVALAPDLLSVKGGTPSDPDQARDLIGQLDDADVEAGLKAAVAWLADNPATNGQVGVVGFCWGGGWANRLAAAGTPLAAAVAYYGRQLPADQVGNLSAPLLLHYAGLDERINAGIAAYTQALDAAGKPYEVFVYEGVNHAFNNDTNAARYDKAASDQAWARTTAFLNENLGG